MHIYRNNKLNKKINNNYMPSWLAVLQLYFQKQGKKTFLYKQYHDGPLMVQRPFYPEDDICHVYILHPPGGIVGGDHLFINIHLDQGSQTLITTPGATKFYRSAGPTAVLKQQFNLQKKSSLEWLPQDNLFFPDVRATLDTHFYLQKDTKLFAWETFCLGHPIMNKSLEHGTLITRLQIWQNEEPLLHERLRIINGNLSVLFNYPLVATVVAMPADEQILLLARQVTDCQTTIAGSTLLDTLLVIRLLDHNNLHMQLTLHQLWHILRPEIIGRAPCPPRIWST